MCITHLSWRVVVEHVLHDLSPTSRCDASLGRMNSSPAFTVSIPEDCGTATFVVHVPWECHAMMHRTNVSQHAQVLQSVQFQLLLPASMNSNFRGNRRGNRHAIFIGALPHQPPRFTEFVSTFRSTHNGIQPQQSSFAEGLAGAWWCNVHIAIVSTDFHGFSDDFGQVPAFCCFSDSWVTICAVGTAVGRSEHHLCGAWNEQQKKKLVENPFLDGFDEISMWNKCQVVICELLITPKHGWDV